MPIPDNRSKYKRTNLFVLRVWCDDADENENENEHSAKGRDEGEGSGLMWRGTVQRAVSGEAHNFEAKGDLIEVLEAMLFKDRKDSPEHSTPRGKPLSKAGLSAHGNHAITVD